MSSDALVFRAREAAQTSDWPSLSQYLRRLLANATSGTHSPIADPTETADGESFDISPRMFRSTSLESPNPGTSSNPGTGSNPGTDIEGRSPVASETWEAIHLALYALQSADFQTRWDIAKLIPAFGMAAVTPLIHLIDAALADEDWELLWFVARTLGEFRHPEGVHVLCQLIAYDRQPDIVGVASQALANIGEMAIPALSERLLHEKTRLPAAQALARMNHRSAINILIQVAQDSDPNVRTVAIASFSHILSPHVLSILMAALRDESARVRQVAVEGMGFWATHMNEQEFLSAVEPLLWDINLNVRRQTIQTLSQFHSDAIANRLNQALLSLYTPEPLQPDLIHALVWTETATALHHLRDYVRDHAAYRYFVSSQIYREIAVTLGQVHAPALKPLATEILVEMTTRFHCEDDIALKQSLAFSLGQLKCDAAIEPLKRLAQDESPRVRLHAASALKHWEIDRRNTS